MRELTKVGIRLRRNRAGEFDPWQSEVYDVETGKCLPAIKAAIVIDPEKPLQAVVTLDLSEVEVTDAV